VQGKEDLEAVGVTPLYPVLQVYGLIWISLAKPAPAALHSGVAGMASSVKRVVIPWVWVRTWGCATWFLYILVN